MKVMAFNGSPRKNWNTDMLLQSALAGAAQQGAETELVHLYDLTYQGCISCFDCKLKGGSSYGRCSMEDDLTAVLNQAAQADALLFGSPIYLGSVTGQMRSFLERLVYPYLVYDKRYSTLFPRKISTAFIYTMNVSASRLVEMGYEKHLNVLEMGLSRTFGTVEALYVTDTYQFDDYSKYEVTAFDVMRKIKRREEEFPKDCRKAAALGKRLAGEGKTN